MVAISERRAVDATQSTDPLRFANHACAPNMVLKVQQGRVAFYALRDIAEGEGDLTARLDANQKDELGELASWFNKFLAKLASDYRKPNGQTVIPPEKGPAFVEALTVGKFHGVGPKTAEKMNRLGIHTGADLKAQTLEFLQQYFGSSGAYYYAIARGHDERRVMANRARKSVGSETTFMEDLGRPKEVQEGIISVLDDVWSYCERTGILGRTVTVKIKYADFQIVTRSRTLAGPVDSRETLERTAIELVRTIYPPPKRIRLLGVTLHNLGPAEDAPAPEPQMTLSF